jgi:aspartate 1-decarboxylase
MKMLREMLCSKIHRARVTGADLNYEGSITIDEYLMEVTGILPYEKVQVLNLSNGARAETYVISGKRNSGEIILNGAIARMVQLGDLIIVLSYCFVNNDEAKKIKPKIVIVDEKNRVIKQEGS